MPAEIRRGLGLVGLVAACALGTAGCGPTGDGVDAGPDIGPVPPGHVAFVLTFRAGPYCREYYDRNWQRIYVQLVESPWRTPTGEFSRGPWPGWVFFVEPPEGALRNLFPQRHAACDCNDCPQPECRNILNDFADSRLVAWPLADGESAVAIWDGHVTGEAVHSCDGYGCIGRPQVPPGHYVVWLRMGYTYDTRTDGQYVMGYQFRVEFDYPEDRVVEYVHDCTRPLPLPGTSDGGT